MENVIKEILRKEKISFKKIRKATSGFTNLVYFVDDKFVIKMSKDNETKKKITKETSIYQNTKLSCVPTFVAGGNFEDVQYLIVSKLKGKSLYSIWHILSKSERQKCVKQIAGMLKEFNKQDYAFLDEEYKIFDWSDYLSRELSEKSHALAQMGFDTKKINNFISKKLPDLFRKNSFSLVYNDAHFDNFIYDDGKLWMIDFDRVKVCPDDYEMLIFKTMCDNPSKFANEEDEVINVKDGDYAGIYEQFKAEYPEMFKGDNTEKRIKIYQFNYLIGQAIECKNTEWASDLLNKFEKIIISEEQNDKGENNGRETNN